MGFEVGKQKNNGQKGRSNRWVSGGRKVWRMQKQVLCNEIAKEMSSVWGKMTSAFSVGKQVGQQKGKKVCFL